MPVNSSLPNPRWARVSPWHGSELWDELLAFQELYEGLINIYKDVEGTKAQPLVFGFIKDESLNAFAVTSRRSAFIGINYGTWVRFGKFISMLLSDSRCFPEIGNASAEGVLPDFYVQHDWARGPILRHAAPLDKERYRLAYLIASAALDFVFLHELWHIILGHVAYRQLNHIGDRIGETPKWMKDGNVIEQAMEMQADGTAAVAVSTMIGRARN
jgi:hypothetical protein